MPSCTIIAKITNRLQNKSHTELSENQAVWKSDNQGFKEATFIQTGRRGRDACRGVERCGEVWRPRTAVPYPRVVDKYQEGYLGSEGFQPQTRPPSPGF